MRTFLLFLTFLFAHTLTAQQRQSVFFEMGGGSGLSLNYDRRLAPESPWGVRAGLGFGFTLINGEMLDRAVVLPLGAYRLVGNHRHSLELGAGMTLGMGWETVKLYYDLPVSPALGGHSPWGTSEESDTKPYAIAFLHTTIGYRMQPRRGFTLRAGLTPVLSLLHQDGNALDLVPYLSFGYAF